MTFDVLIIIVVINAVATLLLWGKVAGKSSGRPKLNKKATTALWRSEPIIPKHRPPKIAGGEYSGLAGDVDRRFFADFKDFADVVNWWLADEFTASRFRLEDLPAGDISLNVDYSSGPTLGRSFAIYYNQTRIGGLEISPGHKYRTDLPEVYTTLQIDWARFFSYAELNEFLGAIRIHVTDQNEDGINARQSIQSAQINTLWDNFRVSQYDHNDDEQWGELTVNFNGLAFFYIDRRDAPARRASDRRR
jgi:hypothetical protein